MAKIGPDGATAGQIDRLIRRGKIPVLTSTEPGEAADLIGFDAAGTGLPSTLGEATRDLQDQIDAIGGGPVLLGTTNPTSGSTSGFSGLSLSGYKKVTLEGSIRTTIAGSVDQASIYINGDTTATNYWYQHDQRAGGGEALTEANSAFSLVVNGDGAPANAFAEFVAEFHFPGAGSRRKHWHTRGVSPHLATDIYLFTYGVAKVANSQDDAITAILVSLNGGAFVSAGCELRLYGHT